MSLAPVTIGPECDWGNCDEPAVAFRNDRDGYGWLPVCETHAADAPDDEIARICVVCASDPCVCHLSPAEQRAHYEASVDRMLQRSRP